MKVPFIDLKAQHLPISDELRRVVSEVVESADFSGGSFVQKFEEQFAAYCGTKHAVGVGSGTDALWLTMKAMGIGPGDEVITVPMTFFATAEAITMTGARPVFVDVDRESFTLDPEHLEKAITPRTRAIMPVHLFGQTASMDAINEIAHRNGIPVIEDASQAHGATYKGKKAGSLAHAGCFSFYPAKNLGAMGEAGAIVTDNGDLAEMLRCLRNHGQDSKNHHPVIGWNSRMDGIQAAVLQLKLRRLDSNNELRRRHAMAYSAALDSFDGIVPPCECVDAAHVYHIYAIQAIDRERLIKTLTEQGIGHGIHYPVPVHLQPAYRKLLGHQPGDFPVSEQSAKRFISLPMFPELNEMQIAAVIDTVRNAVNSRRAA